MMMSRAAQHRWLEWTQSKPVIIQKSACGEKLSGKSEAAVSLLTPLRPQLSDNTALWPCDTHEQAN